MNKIKKENKIKTFKGSVENQINNSKSIVDLIAFMVITVICCLGVITLISAVTQVVQEARTCLDEKFNMVTYTIGSDIANLKDEKLLDYHMQNFEIGKKGFNAILYINRGKVVDVKASDYTINDVYKNTLIEILNKPRNYSILEKSNMPFLFTKSGFTEVAPIMFFNGTMYKYRISRTPVDNVFILSASGQDEYLYKILRIVANAMIYTVIAVPIFIFLTRKWLTIIKEQLNDLENRIKKLQTNETSTESLTKVIHSKNEIGKIASAISLLTKKLDEKANIDQLTGIKNKRYLNAYLLELQKQKKLDSIGVMLIDIDHFKYYNDTYGHLEGDIVLRKVAQNLEKIAGSKNLVARFGGEEFVVVARNVTLKSFEKLCKEMVEGIEKLNIEHKGSPVKPIITISAGGVVGTSEGFNGVNLIEKADNAVYEAKNQGRNRYIINKKLISEKGGKHE